MREKTGALGAPPTETFATFDQEARSSPRRLQLNVGRCSAWQVSQRTRRKPCSRLPGQVVFRIRLTLSSSPRMSKTPTLSFSSRRSRDSAFQISPFIDSVKREPSTEMTVAIPRQIFSFPVCTGQRIDLITYQYSQRGDARITR